MKRSRREVSQPNYNEVENEQDLGQSRAAHPFSGQNLEESKGVEAQGNFKAGAFSSPTKEQENDHEFAQYKHIYDRLLSDKNKRNPTVKKNWGSDEIKLLEYAVKTYLKKKKQGADKLTTHDWKEIANFIPGRTESQCLYKWNLTQHKASFRKSTWQTAEDNILKELVNKHGKKHWQKIANELNERMGPGSSRAGKQCRERWLNHLDDRIRKEPWSAQEDLTLLTKQKIIGNKWSDIVKYLPGRTENMVKNRFNTLAKQKREEKRNTQVKKLDDIIENLEEAEAKDNKDAWIDEKIQELRQTISENPGETKNSGLPQRQQTFNLEDKRNLKFEEKKRFEASQFEKDSMQSPFMSNHKDHFPSRSLYGSNLNTPKINERKNDSGMLYDSTPQQYLAKRTPMDTPMNVFASPYEFPKRQLPGEANRITVNSFDNGGSKNNEGGPRFNPSMLSPTMTPTASRYISQSMNSPSCISTQNSVLKFLKACKEDKGEAEKLKAIKSLLLDFRSYEKVQQDKVLSMVDSMIAKQDTDALSQGTFQFNMKPTKEEPQKADPLSKAVSEKESDTKPVKLTINKSKSTSKVKNMLFSMHKEEAKNKETKSSPAQSEQKQPEKKDSFQKPISSAPKEKPETPSVNMNVFSRPSGGIATGGNTPVIMTPGYEANHRGIEPMNSSMYGSAFYDHQNQMRGAGGDFSGNQFQSMLGKSPYMHSPSPAFRQFNRYGPETPQTGMTQRGASWRTGGVDLYGLNSPLLNYTGRNEQNNNFQQNENNSMFTRRND